MKIYEIRLMKELSSLKYWDVNNLYVQAVPQMLPVNDFKRAEDISGFDKNFMKSYNEERN